MESNTKKSSRLGRGLSSLLATPVEVVTDSVRSTEDDKASRAAGSGAGSSAGSEIIHLLPVGMVQPNPHQPRQRFDESSLEELAGSIRKHGLMQPILVRERGEGVYELIAGERRWRAARLVGLESVPAVVKSLDAKASAEWALVENLQREDLNPLERADAFRRLIEEFSLTHEEVATQVGVDRSNVTNHLRLLRLHPDIQSWLTNDLLSMGHARALAGLEQADAQVDLARKAIEQGWSVRQLESAVKNYLQSPSPSANQSPTAPPVKGRSAVIIDMERQLAEALGTRVMIRPARKKGAGQVTIDYHSLDDFDQLVQRLGITLH